MPNHSRRSLASLRLLAAILFGLSLLAGAAGAEPAPGSWGFSVHGDGGSAFNWGRPAVSYVVSDKTTLELTPGLQWFRSTTGLNTSESHSQSIALGVIRKIGSRKDFRFSYYVIPQLAYTYSKFETPGNTVRSKIPTYSLGAGVQVEYFVIPDLSVAARTGLNYSHSEATVHTAAGRTLSITRAVELDWQALNVNYYFSGKGADGSAAEKSAARPAAGPWALGWAGAGGLYGFWAPSFKRVLTEKTALELIPFLSRSESTPNNGSGRLESYSARVSVVRKLATRGRVDFSYIIEPGVGYAISKNENPGLGFSSRQEDWNLTLGGGLEVEYFLLDDFSLGARALLVYGNTQSPIYESGSSSYSLSHRLFLAGQSLNARWYFGG